MLGTASFGAITPVGSTTVAGETPSHPSATRSASVVVSGTATPTGATANGAVSSWSGAGSLMTLLVGAVAWLV